ncbi:hypothetical protein [Peribacillus muralis]
MLNDIPGNTTIRRPLYEKYYNWVEEIDRKRIEKGLEEREMKN